MSTKLYTKDHEWIVVKDDVAIVGITQYAQEQLGELVFVELPNVGEEYASGEPVVVVESVKAASDVYSPVSGKIVKINDKLQDEPNLVNNSPEEDGWLWKMEITDPEEINDLLDAEAYQEILYCRNKYI